MAYQLTRDDFIAEFQMHMGFLERRAQAFDDGLEDEALPLAGSLRTLLYDTTASTSLLTHLGEKQQLRLLDTAAPIIPDNIIATPGLVRFRGDGETVRYEAPLGDLLPGRLGRFKPFEAWWGDPVTKDSSGKFFSRSDYVVKTANKRFAHVDSELDADWARLTRQSGLGFAGMGSPALTSIRQIAYEADQSLRDQLSHLLR